MKSKIILVICFVLVQLGFALMPVVPGLKSVLPSQPSAREQLEWELQFIGYSFAILTACVSLLLLQQDNDRQKFEKEIRAALPNVRIQKLRDEEFYLHFLAAARLAQHSVNIMYLAARPPDDTQDEDRISYYREIQAVIRRRKEVRFSRIMRNTAQTRPWIALLLRDLTGCSNAFVAVIKDHETADNPLGLSTQVIDSEKVWLVALSAHERKGAYRDLYVESAVLAEGFQFYYDRIWARSDELMNAGRITLAGEKFLKQCES